MFSSGCFLTAIFCGYFSARWLFYEPMLILASQALPMGEAVIVAVVIDVVRRAIKAHGGKA